MAAYLITPARLPRAAANRAQTPADAVSASYSAEKVVAAKASAAQRTLPTFSWAAIDTQDIDELARRLKAAGFTPQEVRTILDRRINQLFSSSPTGGAAKPAPYWRPAFRVADASAEEQRKQLAERMRLYRKYLNRFEDIADDPEQLAGAKRMWGDLSVAKLQAIAAVDADYRELIIKQLAERNLRPGEESNEAGALRLLEQERLADIAKVLTPEEFAAFDLRASPLGSNLRFQLETFKPTEEEYKAIFAINRAYEDRLYDRQLSSDARKALTAEITAKVSAVLGADRALDYDAAANQNSRDQTAGLVSRLGLPARVAAEVRQVQQDLTQRAKDLRSNPGLSSNERNAQLAALARQAESQLTTKLGANGYEAYNDLKGDWIRALQPQGS